MKYYLVGGAVRDSLLGLPIKDRDWVVVGSSPEIMVAKGFKPIAKDFPIFLHPNTKEEYALARTEKKVGRGYKGFVFNTDPTVSLEEDLSRRDLTINAIAQTETGELIDPFGGVSDLQSRFLRHVSPAFCEDPLRVLRVARFLARFAHLGFSIAPETQVLMRKMAKNGELMALVPERVWQECERALREPNPELFFFTLKEIGASAEVFPGFKTLLRSNVSLTKLEWAAKFSPEPWIRFAILTTSSASIETLEVLLESLPLPKRFKQLAKGVYRFKDFIHQIAEQEEGDILNFLELSKAFHREQVYFSDLLKACEVNYYSERKNTLGQYLPTQAILSLVNHLKALPKENDFQQIRALRLASIREWLGVIFCDRRTT